MSKPAVKSSLTAILFSDVVGSVDLNKQISTPSYLPLIGRHNVLFTDAMATHGGGTAEIIDATGDGYFARFPTASAAVRTAVAFQSALAAEPWPAGATLRVRIGIHLGETAEFTAEDGSRRVAGLAVNLAARIMGLAGGSQTLLSRQAFDDARNFVADDHAAPLTWLAHGPYLFKGNNDPIEVYEVGVPGVAPLAPPPDAEKARRIVRRDSEPTLGWRPAPGLEIPNRAGWTLDRKLAEHPYGEVWLARQEKTKSAHVFKFCFDSDRLRRFKRELTLFRLLRDVLGDRPDVGKLFEVQLEKAPFYTETEYNPAGGLDAWATAKGGLEQVPMEIRLDLLARIADAVAAAHSVGVIHTDLKPSNILIYEDQKTGEPRPRLTDFGNGLLADRAALASRDITAVGFTQIAESHGAHHAQRAGTSIYTPPESLAGKPFSVQGDVYSLGVLLYQMAAGDLTLPLGVGWERDVPDPILREDIAACIDGDPTHRLTSVAELAERIRSVEQRREERAHQIVTVARKQRRRRWAGVAVALAAVAVVVSSVVAFALYRQLVAVKAELAQEAHRSSPNAPAPPEVTHALPAPVDDAQRLAEDLIAQGDGLAQSGLWSDAHARLTEAMDRSTPSGTPSLPAKVALWNLYDQSPPPLMTFAGHAGAVSGVAFSPDGRTALSASLDKSLRLWDVATGRQVGSLVGHTDDVLAAAFSSDGRTAVSASRDRTLRLWDVATGKELRTLAGSTQAVTAVTFDPAGTTILSGCQDGTIAMWDVATGRSLRTLAGHAGPVNAVSISLDGRTALSGGDDRIVRVWDVAAGKELRKFSGHVDAVRSVAFSPDGATAVSAGAGKVVRIWEVATARPLQVMTGHAATINSVAFVGPDGRSVVSASNDGTLKLWDVATGREVDTLAGHTDFVTTVAVSPDGRSALSGSADRTLKLWDLPPSRELRTLAGHTDVVTAAEFSADGLLAASAGADGTLRIWDTATGRELRTFTRHADAPGGLAFSPDGRTVRAPRDGRTLGQWDLATGRELPGPAGKGVALSAVAFSSDGLRALIAEGPTVELRDLATGRELRSLAGHTDGVSAVAFSVDGRFGLTGGRDRTVKLWDLATGQLRQTLAGHADEVMAVAFSPTGTTALSASRDRTLKLWDLTTGHELRTLAGHSKWVSDVAFSPDGHFAVSGSGDRSIKFWDPATGRELRTLVGHSGSVLSVSFSPDGDAVLSAGGDDTVGLWGFARASRYRAFDTSLPAARQALAASPADAGALSTFGDWYAFRGRDDWAVEFLGQARAAGAHVSALALARSDWALDRRPQARREFQQALAAGEAPEPYLKLCLAAVDHAPATQPATAALTP